MTTINLTSLNRKIDKYSERTNFGTFEVVFILFWDQRMVSEREQMKKGGTSDV